MFAAIVGPCRRGGSKYLSQHSSKRIGDREASFLGYFRHLRCVDGISPHSHLDLVGARGGFSPPSNRLSTRGAACKLRSLFWCHGFLGCPLLGCGGARTGPPAVPDLPVYGGRA